jgi:hypothetical protein
MAWKNNQPMNQSTTWKMVLTLAGALALTACKSADSKDARADFPRFSQSREITNPYLPLASLKQDILQNENERVERTAQPDTHKTFQIGGQTVEALTVEDREFNASGELTEATRDYFAQDDEGNVYYLGEDVDEYKGGRVVGHSGAWMLGKDTQTPGLLMPAHPKVGDKFKSEDVPHITWEADEVMSVTETVAVLTGTYQNCVRIKETASDDSTEYKLYAPGVGCVKEIEGKTELSLTSHTTQ